VGGVILDTSVPHPARVYDYWLGGKDNFAADRQVAEEILQVMPVMAQIARSCRLFLSAVVHHLVADLPDVDGPYSLPGRYMGAFVPGSYLAVSHASSDIEQDGQPEAASSYNSQVSIPITLRSRGEFARFFDGLELVPPGIAPLGRWTPGATETGPATLPTYTALARKPSPAQ
jgi:S-adenosyl methyltransferase